MAIRLQSQCRRFQCETNTHDDDVNDKRSTRCRKNGGKKRGKTYFCLRYYLQTLRLKMCLIIVMGSESQAAAAVSKWCEKSENWLESIKSSGLCVVSFECGTAVNSEWRWSGRKRGRKLKKVIERRESGEDEDIKWKSTAHSPASYSIQRQIHIYSVTPMSTALEPSSSCHRQLPYLQDDNDDDELFSNTRTRWHFLSFALQVHKCVFHFPLSNFASLSLNSHPLLQPNPIWSFIVTSLRHFSGVVSWWCKWESIRNGGKNVRTSFWTVQLSLLTTVVTCRITKVKLA